MNNEPTEHIIKLDENTTMNFSIPKELDIGELNTLLMKVSKISKATETMSVTGIKQTFKKLSRWTDEELETMKKVYKNTPMIELEKIFDRPSGSIYQKAKELGIKKNGYGLRTDGRKKWTEKEVQIIRKNYKKITNREIGEIIGKSSKQVIDKIAYLRRKNDL